MVRRFYSRNKSPKQTAAHFDLSLNTVKAASGGRTGDEQLPFANTARGSCAV